jgi:hypothetical protein
MDNRDKEFPQSSLPETLIPHLFTGPQASRDSSTRTTLPVAGSEEEEEGIRDEQVQPPTPSPPYTLRPIAATSSLVAPEMPDLPHRRSSRPYSTSYDPELFEREEYAREIGQSRSGFVGRPIETSPIPHGSRDLRVDTTSYRYPPAHPRLLSPINVSSAVSLYSYPPPTVDAPYRPSISSAQWRQHEPELPSPIEGERAAGSSVSRPPAYPLVAPEFQRTVHAPEYYEELPRRGYPREAYEVQGYMGEPEPSPQSGYLFFCLRRVSVDLQLVEVAPYGYHQPRHYADVGMSSGGSRMETESPYVPEQTLRHQYSMPQLGQAGPSRSGWPVRETSTSSGQSSTAGEYGYPSAVSGEAEDDQDHDEEEYYLPQPPKRRRSAEVELEGPKPRTTKKTLIACDFCRGVCLTYNTL